MQEALSEGVAEAMVQQLAGNQLTSGNTWFRLPRLVEFVNTRTGFTR